jgi:heterotetrameric sarcosine oxidase gamma subunit
VSDFSLSPASVLSSHTSRTTGSAGVTIGERTGVSLCSVVARKGAEAALADRVRNGFGVELPRTPRCTGPGAVELIWAGPSQWLVLGEESDGRAFEQQLQSVFGGVASITDQSDGRVIIRVSGPRARDALAKGVLIDLHPSEFKPGATALTVVAYMNAHLWQVDDAPTYDVAMFRSFALAFWEWLAAAAAEYGVATEPR